MHEEKNWKTEEWQLTYIVNAELVSYGSDRESIRLTLKNENGKVRRFVVFMQNDILVNQLIEIASGEDNNGYGDTESLIGREVFVWLEEQGGYLNITEFALPEESDAEDSENDKEIAE